MTTNKTPSPQPTRDANMTGSNGEPLEKVCTFDPNSDPKNENIQPPGLHLLGWRTIPAVPTREMIDAWRMDQSQGRSLESSYLAMLGAAPLPPVGRLEVRIAELEDVLRNFTASRDITYVEALKLARTALEKDGQS